MTNWDTWDCFFPQAGDWQAISQRQFNIGKNMKFKSPNLDMAVIQPTDICWKIFHQWCADRIRIRNQGKVNWHNSQTWLVCEWFINLKSIRKESKETWKQQRPYCRKLSYAETSKLEASELETSAELFIMTSHVCICKMRTLNLLFLNVS